MDVAAFQSMYPDEVRIQAGRTTWIGRELEYFNATSGSWSNLAPDGEAMMFQDKTMNFEMVDGLVKSSIVADKQFAIIVERSLLGFVRGKNLLSKDEEEMNIEIDWSAKGSTESVDFEALDMFSPEDDLKNLL